MTPNQTFRWTGSSGREYEHWISPLPKSFPSQLGNYIFAKMVNNQWVPIYIGEGDLEDRVSNHHRADCIRHRGATHVHVHTHEKEDKQKRLAEESDLLAGHPEAYEPKGCNIKPGG